MYQCPLNCVLPGHSWAKCFNTRILYTPNTDFYNSTKHWHYFNFLIFWHASIPPSVRMPRYWFNSLFHFFFNFFSFFKFNMSSQNSAKNNIIKIILFIISIINIDIIKIYIKNVHFILISWVMYQLGIELNTKNIC